jgi:predicted ATPase/DNA-binding NarL/FixJ family response regulator
MSTRTARTEPDRFPHNLPLRLSSFIGRERELAQLKPLLWSSRLLTLTGFGGCGKTRLALKAAEQLLDAFSDGVWLVELAPITHADLVPQVVAATLGLHDSTSQPIREVLIAHLRSREVLLVLDNCEHLIVACAELVHQIVQRCPEVHILATSREALNIDGEIVWQVPPLADTDAAQLFLDRATAIRSGIALTDRSAPTITRICQQLDGLPLAIELAAVRIKVLSVEGIAARLDEGYALLNSGSRTAPLRHQTLRAMIDWSYDLLSPFEQTLLRCLAVFVGGWTLEAAEAVCRADALAPAIVLDLLNQLIDKSLVQARDQAGEMRYSMLETIRQYALEKLQASSDWQRAHDKHLDYFLDLAERAEPQLRSAQSLLWLKRLDADYDNIRASVTWAIAQRGSSDERCLRLCGALPWYWHARAQIGEARRMVEAALAGTSSRTLARAKALFAAGWAAIRQGDFQVAPDKLRESADIFRARGTAGRRGLGDTLVAQGIEAAVHNDYTLSRQFFEESLNLSRELKDDWGIAQCLNNLASIAMERGDYAIARPLLDEGLRTARASSDKGLIGLVHASCVESLAQTGDIIAARPHVIEGLAFLQELEDYWRVTSLLSTLGELQAQTLQPAHLESAVRLWASAEAILAAHSDRSLPSASAERTLAAARAHLGEAAFTAAWNEGYAFTMPDAIEYALTIVDSSHPIEPADPAVTSLQAAKQKYGGLTARERDVAALVARGQSNREIAQTLVISENTVATHIGKILSKLEFESRTQIVSWAIEKGLVAQDSSAH